MDVILIKYISIEKENLPYHFNMQLGGFTFRFEVHYNTQYDYFTVDLYYLDRLVIYGEKIVYGKPLFNSLPHLPTPPVVIVPLDLSGEENRVTYENMGEKILLYIIGDEDNG